MGGGGGGGYRNIGDVDKLLAEARERLNETGRKNVFISFDYDDRDEVNLLRGQSKNQNSELEFNDWSVKEPFNSENADYIKRKITERIRQSSETVVFLSDKTKNSKWVNWEVEKSIELGKKVIGTYSSKNKPSEFPKSIKDNRNKIKIVPWSELKNNL